MNPAAESALAPVLGARRDGAATAPSSRGLLITILGEMVRTHGAAVWTQTLLEALGLFGVEPKAGRQAISRLAQQGWLHSQRVGRQTRWTLTPRAQGLLETGAERIFGFGQSDSEWDSQWLILLVSVPEEQRALRYRLGVGLRWAGFGTTGQGVWLSPWSSREQEAATVVSDLGLVGATLFKATMGSVGDVAELAAKAWDLPEIAGQYAGFLDRCSSSDSPGLDGLALAGVACDALGPADALKNVIGLVDQWRHFPFIDPDLPAELLPSDWPGRTAAQRFDELHRRLAPGAHQWWMETEERFGA